MRNQNDLQKVYSLNRRALEQATLGQKQLLSDPGNPKTLANAQKLFDQAAQSASEAEEIGKRTGNRVLEYRAAETLNEVTKKQIAAENELTKIQSARQAALEKEKELQEQAVEELKTQVKIFTDNSGDFDKKGNLFSPEEQAKRDKARREAGQKIISSALDQKDLSTLDVLGLAKYASEFHKELSSKPIEVVLTFEKSLASLRAQTKKAFEGLDEKIPRQEGTGRRRRPSLEHRRGHRQGGQGCGCQPQADAGAGQRSRRRPNEDRWIAERDQRHCFRKSGARFVSTPGQRIR